MIKKIKEILKELGPTLTFVGIIFVFPLMLWFLCLIIQVIKEAVSQ